MSMNGETNAVVRNNIVNSHLFGLNNAENMNGHMAINDDNQTQESE